MFLKFASDCLFTSEMHTALHVAASNGHTQACQLLIEAEADVNATSVCAFIFDFFLLVLHCVVFLKFASDFLFQ